MTFVPSNSQPKVKHIIYIPFSGVGLFDDPKDDTWLKYRIEIFKEFTLKSIINQSKPIDLLWLGFDGRYNNPLIKNLLESIKIPVISTHTGLIYTDDKFIFRNKSTDLYESTWKYAWRMFGRALKKRKLYIFTRFLKNLYLKNRSLSSRLDDTLKIIVDALGWFEYIYLTRLDSDDLLHRDYIKEVSTYSPTYKKALIRDKGYVYNRNSAELAEWVPKTCPQFFTLQIPRNIMLRSQSFVDYWKDYTTHEDVKKAFNYDTLADHKYCMLIHGNQISSIWGHPFRGKSIGNTMTNKLTNNILKEFGV